MILFIQGLLKFTFKTLQIQKANHLEKDGWLFVFNFSEFPLFLGMSVGSSCGGETPHSVDPYGKRTIP